MKLAALLVGLVLVGGCEKAEKSSGPLAGDEAALLQYLPAGSTALFGGNYAKFQTYLATSPLQKLMEKMSSISPGMSEWMKCWAEEMPKLSMVGSLRLEMPAAQVHYVMKGIDLAALERCSMQAKFPSQMDADKKYLSYEMTTMGQTLKGGYLVVADGTIYTRQTMTVGGATPTVAPVTRADLEGDLAKLGGKTAAMDTLLVAAMADVDRSAPMWFVASGANTPVSDKVGLVKGSFDLANGVSVDLRAEMKDSALADKIEQGVAQAKQNTSAMGPAKALVEAMQLSRKGDWLRFTLSIDRETLSALIDQVLPMMGALGGSQ